MRVSPGCAELPARSDANTDIRVDVDFPEVVSGPFDVPVYLVSGEDHTVEGWPVITTVGYRQGRVAGTEFSADPRIMLPLPTTIDPGARVFVGRVQGSYFVPCSTNHDPHAWDERLPPGNYEVGVTVRVGKLMISSVPTAVRVIA
jgi:hypothetical protein